MVCTEQPVQRELRFWLFSVPVSLLFEYTPYTSRMKYNIEDSANVWDGARAVCRHSLRVPEVFLYFYAFYAADTNISRSWLWWLFLDNCVYSSLNNALSRAVWGLVSYELKTGVEGSGRGLNWVNITVYTWRDLEHNSKPKDNTCLCRDSNTELSSSSVILKVFSISESKSDEK
jgi:hypothetical protein